LLLFSSAFWTILDKALKQTHKACQPEKLPQEAAPSSNWSHKTSSRKK